MDPNLNYVQALILSPTFELALQIGKVIENMAKFLPHIRIAYAVRDPTISKRNEHIKGKELNVPIVIGTPGTVEDWCRKMKIIDLKKLRVFVIDEADVMISLPGFSQICIDLVKNTIGKDCQTMLFSATYSDEVYLKKLFCFLKMIFFVLLLFIRLWILQNELLKILVSCITKHGVPT
jgi:ATP-dependent RNA helicase DDX19/DBP5